MKCNIFKEIVAYKFVSIKYLDLYDKYLNVISFSDFISILKDN